MMTWFKRKGPPATRQKIEIELSTKCPVKCPLCPQTRENDHYPGWNSGFLDEETLFTTIRGMPDLRQIIFCGAYGDPIYHPRYIEIMQRLGLEYPELAVFTETNGSFRPEEWWRNLGRVTTKQHEFSFSIDGLEDTNPGYRKHADWKSIMKGIRAFRPLHPGIMQWKWIVFAHNQHQVREGLKLSNELGFDTFKLVESQRHTNDSWPTIPFKELEASLAEVQSSHRSKMS